MVENSVVIDSVIYLNSSYTDIYGGDGTYMTEGESEK